MRSRRPSATIAKLLPFLPAAVFFAATASLPHPAAILLALIGDAITIVAMADALGIRTEIIYAATCNSDIRTGAFGGVVGGAIDIAPAAKPAVADRGDLHLVELDGTHGWLLYRPAWVASSSTVAMKPEAPPLQALFGGVEGFLNYAHGQGGVVLACCGTLDLVTLEAGEAVTIGSDHVLAFADTVQCRLRLSAPDGAQSIPTGEGLVFDFAGPGAVLTQTRGPRRLTTWLRANGVSWSS